MNATFALLICKCTIFCSFQCFLGRRKMLSFVLGYWLLCYWLFY